MGQKSDGKKTALDEWAKLSEEEKTRHDVLFYCQEPIEGLMPGEMARDLFLRSGLPLQILSKIWNLVDYPHDNMLDPGEFAVAMHLIQTYLLSRQLPHKLPENLKPEYREEVHVPVMTSREHRAYRRLFQTIDNKNLGKLKAPIVQELLLTSGLNPHQLATVWNLSDINRDGALNIEEFCIACHITRYLKTGAVIIGPVNVQSLLPHKLPKTDLHAKLSRLKELGIIKPKMMTLRERRKKEAVREAKRSEVQKERLKILQLRHEVLKQCGLPWELEALLTNWLKAEEERTRKMEVVAERLRKEHEQIRQETARVIIEEQKLSNDVKELQEEAETLKKKRQRNSLIKDIDPFHQLHEERKEEKLRGIQTIRNEPENKIVIPFQSDPFDRESISKPPLSGQDVFVNPEDAWKTNTESDFSKLTHGFEDNFVEVWNRASKPDGGGEKGDGDGEKIEPWSPTANDKDFFFDDEEDPVFKTVPVTEEEDDLWSTLPDAVLANQNEQLQYLQKKLTDMKEQMRNLDSQGAQLVFRNSDDYRLQDDKANWDHPAVRRRTSEKHFRSKESPDFISRRRSYTASSKSASPPRNQRIEDSPVVGHSKRHSLGTLPEAGKLESVLGLASLSARSKALSGELAGTNSKSSIKVETTEVIAVKYDENSNEQTENANQLTNSISSSPTNNLKDSLGHSPEADINSDTAVSEDTRSPAEKSLAKLFGKRKSLNREKALVDSSDYHIAESASSLTPKSNVTVEINPTAHSECDVQITNAPQSELKEPESKTKPEPHNQISENIVPQLHETLSTSGFEHKEGKEVVKSEEPITFKDSKNNQTEPQAPKKDEQTVIAPTAEQNNLRPRSATYAGSSPINSQSPDSTQSILRPRSSTHIGATRPQSVAEAPPRPPPRRHSKKKRQAPTPPGATSPISPSSPPVRSPLTRAEKAARRISSPPLLQSFNPGTPSGSSTSSSSATPVTSPSKPPRRPSKKKSPAPLPPDSRPFGSTETLGRYDQVRPPGSSGRRAGSLENILKHVDTGENSPVPPPRIKRKQRIRVEDIRKKKKVPTATLR